ncbi:alpha/beta hydrolase [Pacificimonas sp. WHA3]|uniref:Alpha/beta hydrolase n=1 Tax=Pacificimonas pallii TaxID=2827236 RepID=A0ABS6SFA9_9SPHN|nr:alpha/beta hydrolase [Pacificimonas pallii]MBV7257093.1 alpha/beta hydrolase [Pacificimonas pallii]
MRPTLAALMLVIGAASMANAATSEYVGELPRQSDRPFESSENLDTVSAHIQTPDGRRLRTIMTRPEGAQTALPAIFFTQSVACGSVEWPANRITPLREMAYRTGFVTIRVERSGSGDSEGPGCDRLDYDTEVADYRHALAILRNHEWVRPDSIFVYGSSLGSTTAPLVAEGNDVAGVVIQGGGGVTYLERMIGFDRLDLDRFSDIPVAERHDEMLRRIRFQTHYLLEAKTPGEVVAEHPDLDGVWERLRGTDAAPHYGRPHAWHWQAARRNFMAAWMNVNAPVLVLYGEYEPFEMEHGHRTIVQTLNRARPGSATYIRIPRGGHDTAVYADPFAASRFEGWNDTTKQFAQDVASWMLRVIRPLPQH